MKGGSKRQNAEIFTKSTNHARIGKQNTQLRWYCTPLQCRVHVTIIPVLDSSDSGKLLLLLFNISAKPLD